MNVLLWVFQWMLAGIFLMAGSMKLMKTREELSEKMGWVEDFSQDAVKRIGILEVLGAIGLVLPPLTGILSWLSPTAAVGLMLLMLGAGSTHIRRKEHSMLVINAVLFGLASFVAWGRFVSEAF